ncbi:GET complex subunit get1 [Cryptotrichosporon argae]
MAPPLGLLIFAVVLLTQVVGWVGKTVLLELAFSLYTSLFLGGPYAKQRALRRQVLEDKAELGRTSAQDEFAKWAKIQRRIEQSAADLEKINATIASSRSSFATKFNTLLWLLTTGAQFVLVWWYRRQPVFYLPSGWAPAPVAYMLKWPSAPRGSVSSGVWCAVCKRVITTAEEIVKDLLAPVPAPHAVPVPAKPTAKVEGLEHEKLD